MRYNFTHRMQLALALLAAVSIGLLPSGADARPYGYGGVRVGIGFYGPWGYGYGYPYPYYYPPGYVVPPVVVAAPGPYIIRPSSPAPSEALPNPMAAPLPLGPLGAAVPPAPAVVPARNDLLAPPRMDALLQQLSDPSDAVRRDAAIDLGRMRAQRAVEPLMTILAKDPSSVARDGAARALGLIGSPRSLNALIYAAQADNDREVRHSAQFAVEIIRTSLKGR